MAFTFDADVKLNKSMHQLITGTGTAGQAGSSSVAYVPSLWTFNLGMTPVEGDIITIKVPVAGVNAGVWVSVDNGTTYYPVATNNKSQLTTHFPVNHAVTLIYQNNMTTSMRGNSTAGAAAGASAADVTMDRWCVLNYYDTNSTYSPASLGQGFGTCYTSSNVTEKTVTLSNYSLVVGGIVSVRFENSVLAGAKMNINSKGAKLMYYDGGSIPSYLIQSGDVATFIYNGQYHLISIGTYVTDYQIDRLFDEE